MKESGDPGATGRSDEPPLVAHRERIEACPECGRRLHDEPKFCPSCGRRLWGEAPKYASRLEGYAVASIVCAVAGLFALPVVGPVLGIVFGKKALRNIEHDPSLEGAGLAQAGVIIGWVGLIVSLFVLAVLVGLFWPVHSSQVHGSEPVRVLDPSAWPR